MCLVFAGFSPLFVNFTVSKFLIALALRRGVDHFPLALFSDRAFSLVLHAQSELMKVNK